jgi:hypothetical protein
LGNSLDRRAFLFQAGAAATAALLPASVSARAQAANAVEGELTLHEQPGAARVHLPAASGVLVFVD